MSNEKIAGMKNLSQLMQSKGAIGGLAGLGGLGAGAAGIGAYNALKDPDPIEEHPDYAPPPAPEPEPEKDYFDKGMDWAEENIYNPSWDFISQQSQNPGTRKLLTALALIALLGGGSYMFGKNRGKQDILNRFQ